MIGSLANSATPSGRCNQVRSAPVFLLLATIWTSGGTVLYLLAPASAPFVLPLCLVLPLTWHWHARGHLHITNFTPAGTVLAVGAGYALINAGWSPSQAEAYQFGAMLLVVATCAPMAVGAVQHMCDRGVVLAMALGFYSSFTAVGALMCLEVLWHAPMHTWLAKAIPTVLPNTPHDLASGGVLPEHFLNHKMVGLTVLFWPAVLTATCRVSGRVRLLGLCGLVPAAIAIVASEHETSKVALLMSCGVYVLYKTAARVAHCVLLTAWTAACLAVVPLCLGAYAADLHKARWLPASAQHRIVIWKATSDRVFEAPILGTGIHASRTISRREPTPPLAPGTKYRLSVSWHSHNAFLQVWFEAGAVGAGILWIFGMLVMNSIRRTAQPFQAPRFATFSSCALLAATGFSAFAPWFTASFALGAVFASLAVAAALCRRREGNPTSSGPL